MATFTNINSIHQLHQLLGYEKAKHPLVSIIDFREIQLDENFTQSRNVLNLYFICLKSASQKAFVYGKNHYDFQEGTMVFMAPGQVFSLIDLDEGNAYDGWGLFFHPDFIMGYPLANRIKNFSFFSYSVNEGLYLSDDEKATISELANGIKKEYSGNIDDYSQDLIVTAIEQLLNYSQRFYSRQFITRKKQNSDLVSKFEQLLTDYFKDNDTQPTVEYFAEKLHLSPGYLTDLLKRETSKTTKEHIQNYLIENAKYRLLNSGESVSEIAFTLGFEYPQYFNRLFKQKTGKTPLEYRNMN